MRVELAGRPRFTYRRAVLAQRHLHRFRPRPRWRRRRSSCSRRRSRRVDGAGRDPRRRSRLAVFHRDRVVGRLEAVGASRSVFFVATGRGSATVPVNHEGERETVSSTTADSERVLHLRVRSRACGNRSFTAPLVTSDPRGSPKMSATQSEFAVDLDARGPPRPLPLVSHAASHPSPDRRTRPSCSPMFDT